MDRTISQGEGSSIGGFSRPMAVSSRQKFENVEKLSTIVREAEGGCNRPAQPEEILEIIKKKIKSSYTSLYENYDMNKNAIKKTIQQTENNDAGENAMKSKFENVIKEKNAYDRMKAEVENKQRKLKKLVDIREQVKTATCGNDSLRDVLADRTLLIRLLEEHREMLDYETAVLKHANDDRVKVKLALKERHESMLKENNIKKERIRKIEESVHTKKILLQRIEEKIVKEEECEIPLSLAEELEKKLQEYQGKYAQENIVAHEMRLTQAKALQEQELLQQEQDLISKIKLAKESEDKREFDIAHNFLLLREAEEEKIKKLCGVASLRQITNDGLLEERQNLEHIRANIDAEISALNSQNDAIRADIEHIMTTMQNEDSSNLLLKVEQELEEEETQLRRLKAHNSKKDKNLTEWTSLVQAMCERSPESTDLAGRLRGLLSKYEGYALKERIEEKTIGNNNRKSSHRKSGMKLRASDEKTESQIEEFDS